MQQRAWFLKQRYGISVEEFDEMLAKQGGGCAICNRPSHGAGARPLHVDHDHATGKFRGVLCASCNRALGYFQESPERIERAASYLRNSMSA